MFRLIFLLLLIVSAFSIDAKACSCSGPLNFCETLHDNDPALVVLAVKKIDQGHGMQIDIVEILKGVENRQQVMVWGDNGFLCRHFASQWNVGDTVIFSIDLIGPYSASPQEDSTDYFISVCGTYFLNYSSGQVAGAINGTDVTMSYASFKNSLSSCITKIATPNRPQNELVLYPNPAYDFVEISLPVSFLQPLQIQLFSLSGKELMPDLVSSPETGNVKLNTATLPRGSYIIVVKSGEDIVSRRFAVL